ncbi:acyl carrier protein [Burkholderia seminalis]|uniref:acyl carrier protein n=1 Tax=Burkholderia seminalis TaxID=488731 RepID=UPI000F590511|nr:acyl carrier protein [Burkholderia seminalis]RQS84367.1 acyl carrier protein [Burkholderia seminalis]
MQHANVEERVKKIVAEQLGLGVAEVRNDAHIVNDLGADELDAIEIVMNVEDDFDIVIDDDQAEKLETVQQVIDHVQSL